MKPYVLNKRDAEVLTKHRPHYTGRYVPGDVIDNETVMQHLSESYQAELDERDDLQQDVDEIVSHLLGVARSACWTIFELLEGRSEHDFIRDSIFQAHRDIAYLQEMWDSKLKDANHKERE